MSQELIVNGAPSPRAAAVDSQSVGSESADLIMDTKGRIFVAKIPRTVTEDEFKEYFETFGEVKDAYMPKDRTQRYYRGIGFVTYAEEESAGRVMEVKHSFHDQEVVVDFAIPPKKQQKERKEGEAAAAMSAKASAAAPEATHEGSVAATRPPSRKEPVNFNGQLPILHEMSLAGTPSLMDSIGRKDDQCPSTRSPGLSGLSLPVLSQPEYGSFVTSYTGSKFVDAGQPYMGYCPPQVSTMPDPPPPLQFHHQPQQPQQPQQECVGFSALGTFHELEALMRTSSSLDFSLNGSMKHSHSFASTTDLSMVFDSSSDLMSSGAYSQESESVFRPQQETFPPVSQDDILQALRESSYAKPPAVQQLQLQRDLAAIAAMQRMAAVGNAGGLQGASLQSLGLDRVAAPQPSGWGLNASGIGVGGMNGVAAPMGFPDVMNRGVGLDALAPLASGSPASMRKWQREAPRAFTSRMPRGLSQGELSEHSSGRFAGPLTDAYLARAKDCIADPRGLGFAPSQPPSSIEKTVAHGANVIKGHHGVMDRVLPMDMSFFD